jgi:hypothetical protein
MISRYILRKKPEVFLPAVYSIIPLGRIIMGRALPARSGTKILINRNEI